MHFQLTYSFVKVRQTKLFWIWEEFSFMHKTDVKNDVGSFFYFGSFNVVIFQGFSHCKVNHRMKPHRLINELLQHLQVLMINILSTIFTYK